MKIHNKNIIKKIIRKRLKISVAESCTGGLLSSTITSVAGSSKIFNFGLVTYSNQSKIKILKIPKKIVRKYGAVSEQVCKAMVKKVSEIDKTNISISVTGIAGPKGATKKKPVGLIYIGIKKGYNVIIKKYLFKNKSRSYIQKAAVNQCLKLILRSLE